MIDFDKEEAIGRQGSFSRFDMEVIYGFVKDLKEEDTYVEVGVQYGRSLDFVKRNSKAQVFGIDAEIEKDIFKPVEGTTYIAKPSNEAVKDWDTMVDVLFIDGDHSYEGCMDDWKNFSPFVKKGGWVVFHDCDETSPGVVKVFDEIDEGWKNKGKSPEQRCSMAWVQRG